MLRLQNSKEFIVKKTKLIEMLNSIKGNPEIKLWNGLVQDWTDIDTKLVEMTLVRMTESYWLESVRIEHCIGSKDWSYQLPEEEVIELKKQYKTVCKWENNPYVTKEDIDTKRYSTRIVQIMQSKFKGEQMFDRNGTISY